MAEDPIATECSNAGYDDRWTCPGCYEDIDGASSGSTYVCRKCGNSVACTLEYQPVCHSRITDDTDA